MMRRIARSRIAHYSPDLAVAMIKAWAAIRIAGIHVRCVGQILAVEVQIAWLRWRLACLTS